LLCALGLSALLAVAVVLGQPDPAPARANVLCEIGSGPAGAVTGGIGAITGGAIGGGNPVGDACNEVTDGAVEAVTKPITEAVKGLGNSIFEQITQWASEGASWLIKQVVTVVSETTTPKLTSAGFLSEYGQMSLIAVLLASAMLLAAVLEGIAQGNLAMLGRVVLVNLPLAFIATSVAYVVVQLLLVGTDGLCHAISSASQQSSQRFFKGALVGLGQTGGKAGEVAVGPGPEAATGKASGEVAVPLFVSFLAAIIGAFAAFFVWVELLMRDAAVYVVALFMPLALAASIWPRWSGTLRRSGELVVVVIGSKFVIVSIIALAAGLVGERGSDVEHVLAASALMLLACFSPFALFRLVPFAEGAMAAAYGRRHAGASAVGGARSVSSAAQTMQRTARSSWGGGGSAPGPGGGGGTSRAGRPGGAGSQGASKAAAGAAPSAAAGGLAAAGSLPVAAARGAQSGTQRLAQSAEGQVEASEGSEGRGAAEARPAAKGAGKSGGRATRDGQSGQASKPARPTSDPLPGPKEAPGGSAPGGGEGPVRPAPQRREDTAKRKGDR
jgi:uncharacterized membrane protein